LLRNRGVLSQVHVSLCQHDFVLKRSHLAQTRFSKGESPRSVVPEFAVEQVEFVPSTEPLGKENGTLEPGVPDSVRRRCEVSGWYGLSVSVLKAIGVFAAVAAAARGVRRLRSVENVAAQSVDRSRAPSSGDEMMDLETLRELQQRGRFYYEMFPGAKASEEWLRHRDQLERQHAHHSRSSPAATNEPTEKLSDSE
jgi:hypothetical protein